MKKLIAYVIVIFFLNNLLVSQNINSKGFYIKEIVENCPWGEPEEYRFPLLKGSPDSIVKKINDNFILNFLDLDVDSMKSSVFENVWGTKCTWQGCDMGKRRRCPNAYSQGGY